MSYSIWDHCDYSEDEFTFHVYKSSYERFDGKESWMVMLALHEEFYITHFTARCEEEAYNNERLYKERAASNLDCRKRNIVKKYSSLGLREIKRMTDEDGRHYYFCELSTSVFDKPKKITARTISEMEMRLENAVEDLIGSNEEFLLFGVKRTFIKNRMENLSPDLQEIVWKLIDLSVFGSDVQKNHAQNKMCEILGLETKLELKRSYADSKEIYRALDEQEPNAERDAELFQSFFHEVLDVRKKFSANKLANIVGCTAGTISRIRSGEISPKKDLVLKIGVAFELSESELVMFVRSAGYNFPTTKRDIIIQYCLRDGIYGYDRIRYRLYQYDRDTDF